MSALRDANSQAAEAASAVCADRNIVVVPVRLARLGDAAHSSMLSRVLPDDGVSRLDVAAFQSSI